MIPKSPITTADAFNQAAMCLPTNAAIKRINTCYDDFVAVAKTFAQMGQRRFINLARKSSDSNIAWALYGGNGLVFKVIPEDYANRSKSYLYTLPPITSTPVKSVDRGYIINTYPYIKNNNVTEEDVEYMRGVIANAGLNYSPGDDAPRNLRRMPDKDSTITGIDDDMYSRKQGTAKQPQAIQELWTEYVHALFPIYKTQQIEPQNNSTDFSFISIHDENSHVIGFDPQSGAKFKQELAKPRTSLWSIFSKNFW